MALERLVVIPYTPRAIWADWHDGRSRESCVVAHRRAGKTVAVVNEMIRSALTCKLEAPRTAYAAPTYNQAKRIAWDYAKRFSAPIPDVKFNEAELRIDYPNGGRFQLLGQDNPDSLRGAYFDDIACDEYQMWHPRVFGEIIRPALADRKGRIVFSGTPAGTENPLYEAHKRIADAGGYTRIHKASETGLIDAEELKAARASMSDEQYAAEFECSWTSSIIGAIYARALSDMESRIRDLPILPSVPVDVAFDLGRSDATAMWFVQVVGPEIRIIDHYEKNGEDITHYIGVMEERRRQYGFQYGTVLLPHDAQHKHMTGESVADTFRRMRYNIVVCKPGNASQEIHTVRMMLRSVWIDPVRCEFGIKCLRNYRYEYNEERKTFYDRPVHDWASHTCDALRVYAVNRSLIASSDWGSNFQQPRYALA